jgi:predicted alpha/beta-fold hydrolase
MVMRRLLLSALLLLGSLSGLFAQKSQQEYLTELRRMTFKPWHFNSWDAVLHPIDHWLKHTKVERREARRKVWDFLKGREFLPAGFQRIRVPAGELTLDGAVFLAAEARRPLIVMVPGTFGSHLSSYLAETAQLLAQTKRFHVMLVSSRMSATTIAQSKVVGSGGWFEAEDILAAVRWARRDAPFSELVGKVGLYGVSLSCDYVVHAMARDTEGLVDAGLMVSGAYDLQALARDIDAKAKHLNVAKYYWARLFKKYLRTHLLEVREALALPWSDDEVERMGLADYVTKIAWPHYRARYTALFGGSFGPQQLVQLCTALNSVPHVKRPLLAIHSHQDRYLGYAHADRFVVAAHGNPNVALEYVDGAQHANYFIHDPAWFQKMMDTYYGYWLAEER